MQFLHSRLVAMKIATPSIRSRMGKYILPPVLILRLLLVLVKGTSYWCRSAYSKICFVLMRSASFSLTSFDSASMQMLWKVSWPVSSVPDGHLFLSLSMSIAAFSPGGLDVTPFFDLPIISFKSSVLSSSFIKVFTFPLIILIDCHFVFPSWSDSWTPAKLQTSLRPINSNRNNISSSCNRSFSTKPAIFKKILANRIIQKYDLWKRNVLFLCCVVRLLWKSK